jgi:glycerol-3-phosphate cytidylyltransferase
MIIGVIAGNFDCIHPGYIRMFDECKKNCNQLVVLLHKDPSIERPEKLKPVLSIEDREKILLSLRQVDKVIPYSLELDLINELKQLNPSVRFLGDDYIDKPFTGDDLNIPIVYLSRSHGWSTTKYKQEIAKSLKSTPYI